MIQRLLIVLALVFISAEALAQTDDGLTFDGKLAAGHKLYLAGDYQGALGTYQEAKEMQSGDARSYYFIGCAQAKLEKYDEAVAILKTASTIAGDKDQNLHAKALFMVAVLEERRASFGAAKVAWKSYISYANGHKDATTFVPAAEDRIKVIETREKLEKEYAPVKEKAPAEKKEAAPVIAETAGSVS